MLSDTAAAGELYRRTNVLATQELATAAARAGVRRLVYVSSIKVNGEGGARAYTADDVPSPEDAYGRSKMQAELLLPQCAGSMEIAVVRPPLVYGPGVRANFLRLMEWIDHERPLPLGLVDNRRSLVSVWNVCDLIAVLATHPRAAGGTWLVSDGEDLSTPELIRRLAAALQRRSRLLPVPASLLRLAATLTGRRAEIERLCGSLTVDISRTREVLGWAPPVPVEAALMRTASWFHTHVR